MIATVNVIEGDDNGLVSLVSYHDNFEGNRLAEERFRKIAKENDFTEDRILDGLEEGTLEQNGWKIYIMHSTESK